jgi:hypothetical protein
MKRTIYALVSALALLGSAPAAKADDFSKCMIQAVGDCDKMFPPSDFRNVAIRGWCYMIHTGICSASKPIPT